MILNCGGKALDLSRPRVMGILNVTPDSFSDGGRYAEVDAAVEQALRLAEQGAAILDIGGESTRPGAQPVSAQQELDRVLPVLEAVTGELEIPVSVDTSKPEVMRDAVCAGAGMINDVNALRADGALTAAHAANVPVCLMHMQGEPRSMQSNPQYHDVVTDIKEYLAERVAACEAVGIARECLLVDPGFGFGKTLEHNLTLLAELHVISDLEIPLLVGISRKSMIGAITGREVADRLPGSIAASILAAERGALVLRVHDVAETVDALAVLDALEQAQNIAFERR